MRNIQIASFILACSLGAAGQSGTQPLSAATATQKPHGSVKAVKADTVTINMPEGMTRDQADSILQELKAIHQLLSNQTDTRTTAAAAPRPSDKVKMSVGQGWYALGRDDAPVTMVEFTDYQCPYCRRFETANFDQLKKEYIDTGKVRFVSRDLPLDFHPNAPGAALAARCAGEQGKFWDIREAMMRDTETDLGPASLSTYGEKVNLNMEQFHQCLDQKKYADVIKKDTVDANTLGISGTPSFVIGKTDKNEIAGVRIVGAVAYPVFESAINDALAEK